MRRDTFSGLGQRGRSLAVPGLTLGLVTLVLAGPGAATAQTNVALAGTATQSSTDYSGDASRAIDGSTDGWFPDGSVTHTAGGADSSPWWQVDLGQDHQIDEIVLWNRTDCCSERLSDFTVEVETSAGAIIDLGTYASAGPSDFRPDLPPGGVVGRIVRIQLLFDAGNPTERYLTLAEVQVYGTPAAEPPAGQLPLGRDLLLNGSQSWKSKATLDGPSDVEKLLLEALRTNGFKGSKVPFECNESVGGVSLARIRFESGDANRFELTDLHGRVVSGTYVQKGDSGEKVVFELDDASRKSLKKMLKQAALECWTFDQEDKEKIVSLKAGLDRFKLKGKVVDGDTFVLSARLEGGVKWTKKQKKLGKYWAHGSVTQKLKLSTPLVPMGPAVPDVCVADQGMHVYPKEGGFFEGWVELTEVQGSDLYDLILSDDFVSILRDFEGDFDSLHSLLQLVDEHGVACADGRTLVQIELSDFGKTNLELVVDTLEYLESALEALEGMIEHFYNEIIVEIAAHVCADLVATFLEAIL